MMQLYWNIGSAIIQKQKTAGWGAKVIDNLAQDLKVSFPEMKGISPRNLKYMRKFAAEYQDFTIVQSSVAQLSWRHNTTLLDKIKDANLRLWYAQKSLENGWTRDVMVHQIETNLHQKIGKLPNNFKSHLPLEQSEAVLGLLKDEYIFDFIAQDDKKLERELEAEMVQNITDFLLTLGKGFAFVGRQFHLEVGGQDFYIDLLFYHFKIKCFVVVELKIDEFKPEYVGKLNFYLSAVDDILKQESDIASIGLLLCKAKNDIIVEYSLRKMDRPMGVASYQLTKQIPDELKNNLPSEAELKKLLKKKK
jgi:predicted nuclease of restriction endonuclease-like (RecB) superfamily